MDKMAKPDDKSADDKMKSDEKAKRHEGDDSGEQRDAREEQVRLQAAGGAAVEPHLHPQLQFQPHGQAGQPQNRPAHEGHQGVTPIQPEDQDLETGVSPTEAVTHSDPRQKTGTEYTDKR
jgi:hypothetical protein